MRYPGHFRVWQITVPLFFFCLLYYWQEISSKWPFKSWTPWWLIFLVYYTHFQKMRELKIQEMLHFLAERKHLGFFWGGGRLQNSRNPRSHVKYRRFRNHHLWLSRLEQWSQCGFKGQKEGRNDGFPLAGVGFNFVIMNHLRQPATSWCY